MGMCQNLLRLYPNFALFAKIWIELDGYTHIKFSLKSWYWSLKCINNKKIEHLASVTLQYFHKHQNRCTQRRYAIYVVFSMVCLYEWTFLVLHDPTFSILVTFAGSTGRNLFLSFVKNPYLANQDYFENLISDCLVGDKFGNKISKER